MTWIALRHSEEADEVLLNVDTGARFVLPVVGEDSNGTVFYRHPAGVELVVYEGAGEPDDTWSDAAEFLSRMSANLEATSWPGFAVAPHDMGRKIRP
jgi:hypothetical protein